MFKKYNENYLKKFGTYPNEITILTYDALGLIYYAWKTNDKINRNLYIDSRNLEYKS